MSYFLLFLENLAVYFYLIIILRILGKKEMSRLTLFDFILYLLISELMTLSLSNKEISFFYGAFCALVLVFIDKLISYIELRFKSLRRLLDGKPSYIIFNGDIDFSLMKKLNYSIDDLYHQLRQNNISSISEVDFALLETNGNLSTITKKDNEVILPESVIIKGHIRKDLLKKINKDEKWLLDRLKKEGIDDLNKVMLCVIEKDRLYVKRLD